MGHALAQVRFARDSGLAEDVCINTFHFETAGAGVTQAEAEEIATRCRDFYTATWAPNTVAIRTFLSEVLANTGHEVRVYDQAGPAPHPPTHTLPFSMTPGNGALPSEVALCLSFRGSLLAGVPQSRRRGRVYLGPLNPTVAATIAASDMRPLNGTLDQILNAARSSLQPNSTDAPFWSVASQPDPTGPTNLVRITTLWMDNSFDTQRRRGADPTVRQTVTINVGV